MKQAKKAEPGSFRPTRWSASASIRPVRRRSSRGQKRHAAGDAESVQEQSQRSRSGCGRTTPATPRRPRLPNWPAGCIPSTWPSAAGRIRRSGSSARSGTACGRQEGLRRAYTWVEHADWIPAVLTGTDRRRSSNGAGARPATRRCSATSGAATRTRSFCPSWTRSWGCADAGRQDLCHRRAAGDLTRTGPKARPAAGIPVAMGAFDAHLGGVGSGIAGGLAGQDHRHQHLRHGGLARTRDKLPGHPGHLRHRGRLDPAGLLRPGSGPVGGRRHFQLVRQLHPARRQRRLARQSCR
jgi:hypothetical protein